MTTSQTRDDCQSNDPNNLYPIAIESLRFPLDSSIRIVFTGYFNGFNVEVKSVDESTLLHHMGCFGKGSASRSKPQAAQTFDGPNIMRKRQYLKRHFWYRKFGCSKETSESDLFLKDIDEFTAKVVSDCERQSNKDVVDLVSSEDENSDGNEVVSTDCMNSYNVSDKQDIVVIVPNSDSEDENYFANMKSKCCINKVRLQEKLVLSLQEAFFLSRGLGCLQIINDNKLLGIEECWELFKETENNFVLKYVVYHHFRSKGYIVKPGIKFGGDYLLYKEGPGVVHADYIVVIKDGEKQNIQNFNYILGHVRMATTTVKEIIIVEVVTPTISHQISLEDLKSYKVRELLLSRNIPGTINDEIN